MIVQVQKIGISRGKNVFHGFHGFHGSTVDFTGLPQKQPISRTRDTVKKEGPCAASSFSNRLKINLMTAVVESILLYGSETWTFTKELTSRVDGVYTRLLRLCLNVSWKDKWTNEKLYHGLPKVYHGLPKVRGTVLDTE